jgi:hypothetical protein
MPYSELELSNGNWDLKMDVQIIYKQGGLIKQLTTYPFNYKQGNVTSYDNVTWELKQIWVDYNITQSGKKGMLVHVNFEVTGLQGVKSYLSVRVIDKDSENFVRGVTSAYKNSDGDLRGYFNMTPGYETTVYRDATVFLPYNEFNLPKGRYNLTLDVDLGFGDRFEHLGNEDFTFTQP